MEIQNNYEPPWAQVAFSSISRLELFMQDYLLRIDILQETKGRQSTLDLTQVLFAQPFSSPVLFARTICNFRVAFKLISFTECLVNRSSNSPKDVNAAA